MRYYNCITQLLTCVHIKQVLFSFPYDVCILFSAVGAMYLYNSGKKGKKGGQRQTDPVRQQNYLKLKGRCFNCGDPKHSKKDCTLPSSTKCSKCQKLGHLAKVCMNSGPLDIQPLAKARQVQDDDSSHCLLYTSDAADE